MKIRLKVKINLEDVIGLVLMITLIWRNLLVGVSWREPILSTTRDCYDPIKYIIFALTFYVFIKRISVGIRIEDIISAFAIILTFLSYRVTKEDILLIGVVIVVLTASREASFHKNAAVFFYTEVFCLLILFLAKNLGLVKDNVVYFSYGVGHSMGMAHPNNLAALIVNIVLLGCWLKFQKRPFIASGILAVSGAIVYKYTVSRTSAILLFSMIVGIWGLHVLKYIRMSWVISILRFSVAVCLAASVYMTVYFRELKTVFHLDKNFITRFTQAAMIYKEYGIKVFGNNIKFVKAVDSKILGIRAVILDNGYLSLILFHGIVMTVLFVLAYWYLCKNVAKVKDYYLLMVIVLFLLSGIMEKSVYTIQYNFTMMGILSYDFVKRKRKVVKIRFK